MTLIKNNKFNNKLKNIRKSQSKGFSVTLRQPFIKTVTSFNYYLI